MSAPGHLLSPGHLLPATHSFPAWLLGLCNQTIQFPIWPDHCLECWMTLDKLFNISELEVP